MAHQGCILCDERDGEFSIVGIHKAPSRDTIPLVVSVKGSVHGPGPALGTTENPKPKNVLESKVQQLTTPQADQSRQENPPGPREGSDAGSSKKAIHVPPTYYDKTTRPLSHADVNWRYLFYVLSHCSSKVGTYLEGDHLLLINSIHADKRTSALFNLQNQRDVVRREGATLSLDTLERVRALLIQITGRESMFPCFECLRKRGPFVGCILDICPGDSPWVRPCGNCVYLGIPCGTSSRPTQTDDNTGPKKRSPMPAQGPQNAPSVLDTKPTNAVPKQPNLAPSQGSHNVPSGLDTRPTNTTTHNRQSNMIPQASHGSLTPPVRDPGHAEVPQALPVPSSNPVPRTTTTLATGLQPINVPCDNSSTHLVQDAALPQGEILETEPWEEAPGRIRSSTSSVPNSKS